LKKAHRIRTDDLWKLKAEFSVFILPLSSLSFRAWHLDLFEQPEIRFFNNRLFEYPPSSGL
jgi:hypothetical protein